MDLRTSSRPRDLARRVMELLALAAVAVAGSALCGRLFAWSPIQKWHESTFEPIVEGLQAIPLLLSISRTLTDAGHTSINFLMLLLLTIWAVLAKRRASVSWVLMLLGVAIFMRPFQSLVTVLVDGTTPVSPFIEGTAGPYFSGGVFRVLVIFGAAAALFGFQRRSVVIVAVVAGSIEGLTRMVLGRHWPLDIVASVPIGLAVLLLMLMVEEFIADLLTPKRSSIS